MGQNTTQLHVTPGSMLFVYLACDYNMTWYLFSPVLLSYMGD